MGFMSNSWTKVQAPTLKRRWDFSPTKLSNGDGTLVPQNSQMGMGL